MVYPARELLVRQRLQLINALRGHLGELGHVAPQKACNISKWSKMVEDCETVIPQEARAFVNGLVETMNQPDCQINGLDAEIARRARANEMARRQMTVPGVGPLKATALVAESGSLQ